MPAPFDLTEAVPKDFRAGAHRLVAPSVTVARVRRLMPVMGITRIANVTGLDRIGIPVVMVYRPNARSIAVWQGKGIDLPAAQASGLMECAEAYHAEHITLPVKLASYAELRYTHRMVDIIGLPRTPDQSFDPSEPIHWIEGYDLLQQASTWVPYALVHTNFTLGLSRWPSGFLASSNGLASGNHRLEAISHGISEIVERDARALWTLADTQTRAATRIALASVTDPYCRDVLDKYAAARVAVGVWDMTSDVGMPAFICGIMDKPDAPHRRPTYNEGMGCHPARDVALLRALTEAAQTRLSRIVAARDDYTPTRYAHLDDPELNARRWQELSTPPDVGRSFDEMPDYQGDTITGDVHWQLDRLRAVGIQQVVVVDLTRPEFGLPVVRVVIPGLEYLVGGAPYVPGRRALARLGQTA